MQNQKTNFSFIKKYINEKDYEDILKLECNLINYDADYLDSKIGNIFEGYLKICLKKYYDYNFDSLSINDLIFNLKDHLESINEEIPSPIWLIFDQIKKLRNIASHSQNDINKLYIVNTLIFEQKISRLLSLFISLIYLYNTFFSDQNDGILLRQDNFNYKIYYEINNVTNDLNKNNEINLESEINDKNDNSIYIKDDQLIELEKISIGSFLSKTNKSFFIPAYQRKYSWRENEVLGLLESIKQNKEENFESQYFGAIAVSSETTTELKQQIRLIDGQQRITTSLIIFKVVYDLLMNKFNYSENKLPDYLFNLFANNIAKDKLKNGNQKETQQQALIYILDKNNKGLDKEDDLKIVVKLANTNIYNNYKIVLKFLEEKKYEANDLLNFIEYFANSYKMAEINFKKDKKEEMQIFENLNSKGMELTTMELIKNTLFLKIITNEYEDNEDKIVKKFNENLDFENIINFKYSDVKIESLETRFFYTFLAYKNKTVNDLKKTQKELLLSFNDYLKIDYSKTLTYYQYNEVIDNISKYATAFIDLTFKKWDTNINHYLHPFGMYLDIFIDKEALTPLYFYFLDTFSDSYDLYKMEYRFNAKNKKNMIKSILEIEKWVVSLMQINGTGQSLMTKALKIISVLDYYKIERYKNNTSDFLDNIPKLIRYWLSGKLDDKNGSKLEADVIPSKEEFRSSLIEGKVIRAFQNLLVRRIESYYVDKEQKGIGQIIKDSTIEHIFPQNEKLSDSSNWFINARQKYSSLSKEDLHELQSKEINKLGNLVILESQLNSKIKDSDFNVKQRSYKTSSTNTIKENFGNGKNLLNIDDFDFDLIEERNIFLVNILLDEIYNYD